MDHKFILQFYLKGNLKKPIKFNYGRFTSRTFDHTNVEVLFKTEAQPDEKIYDIIQEINHITQKKAYYLEDLKTKYIYLDKIEFTDKNITVKETQQKNKIMYFDTSMFLIGGEGSKCRLEINLE